MALIPEIRIERFLAGQYLDPAVRLEYFLAGAAGYGLAALQDEAPAIASGGTAVATIQDAADNVPLQSLVVAVDPLQEGSGDPAPDNERPIVPRNSVSIKQTGKNLIKNKFYQYTSSVLFIGADNVSDYSDLYLFLKAGSYTVSFSGSKTVNFYINTADETEQHIGGYGVKQATFTLAEDQNISIYIYFPGIVPADISELQLESGGSKTTYEAYTETNYAAKLPENFYGGSVDVVRGIATKKYVKIDMGSIEWTGTGSTRFSGQISNIVKNSVCYCSELVTAAYSDVYNHVVSDSIAVHPNAQQVEVYMPEYDSPLDFAAAMAGVELCYEVTDPTFVDIDQVTILTLPGVNNISADTGNVLTLEYKQDPEASANEIKAIIAPVLPEMKADANLVANDFRIVGNTLYKITANVASGAALTPGSNCTATTVGAQLKALLNA